MKKTTKVLIADNHAIVRAGISTVVGFADGKVAVRKTKELHPDVVIMDLKMHVMNGVNATKAVVVDELDRAAEGRHEVGVLCRLRHRQRGVGGWKAVQGINWCSIHSGSRRLSRTRQTFTTSSTIR